MNAGAPDTYAIVDSGGNAANDLRESWTMVLQIGLAESLAVLAPSVALNTPPAMDAGQGLTFAMYGNDTAETYGLRSISITIEGPVPEPATLALLAIGLAGLIRRREA